jgi:GDP/UDP-N,N'-diacetylbacillosamine 2-epimerase (hydrolysing)
MRRVCVVTGTRAEYGLLRWVMEGIRDSDLLELELVVTGAHLSPEFGCTYQDIEADGFTIDRKVEMLLSSDTAVAISKSVALAIAGMAEAFDELKPDIVLLLGDRYEIWAAGVSATLARLPIAHIHGGELTEGLVDEAIRHGLTKMAHLHFVSADVFRQRVIQLGESPDRVFTCGAVGLDSIAREPLMSLDALQSSIGVKLGQRNLLVTFHPVTLESDSALSQMESLLNALDTFPDVHTFITLPNADMGSRGIVSLVHDYVGRRPRATAFTSLGQVRYHSLMHYTDGVVGNSSSGLIEAPAMHKPTVNIGSRQDGRIRAASIIDCEPETGSIIAAIRTLYSIEIQSKLSDVTNPYGVPGGSAKILEVLESVPLEGILMKRFHDLEKS